MPDSSLINGNVSIAGPRLPSGNRGASKSPEGSENQRISGDNQGTAEDEPRNEAMDKTMIKMISTGRPRNSLDRWRY